MTDQFILMKVYEAEMDQWNKEKDTTTLTESSSIISDRDALSCTRGFRPFESDLEELEADGLLSSQLKAVKKPSFSCAKRAHRQPASLCHRLNN